MEVYFIGEEETVLIKTRQIEDLSKNWEILPYNFFTIEVIYHDVPSVEVPAS